MLTTEFACTNLLAKLLPYIRLINHFPLKHVNMDEVDRMVGLRIIVNSGNCITFAIGIFILTNLKYYVT